MSGLMLEFWGDRLEGRGVTKIRTVLANVC